MRYLSHVARQTLLLPRTTSAKWTKIARSFSTIGVDNFGPLLVKNVYDNANNKMHKAWVTFYTCAFTRNIILDLILTKKQFKTFYKPDNVISGNASNFVAIEAQNFAGNLKIKWHFNLALAPWHWKFFKRLVRSVKQLSRKDLRNYKIMFSWKITNCKQFYLK